MDIQEDPHLRDVQEAAAAFAAAMEAAHVAGKRCVVIFAHYRPPRTHQGRDGVAREIVSSETTYYVQAPTAVREVYLVNDDDV